MLWICGLWIKSNDKPHSACRSFDQMFVPGPLKKQSLWSYFTPPLHRLVCHPHCVLTIHRQITGSKFGDLHSTHSQTIWGCAKHRKSSCTTKLLVVAKHRVAQPSADLHFHSSVHKFRPVYTVPVHQVLWNEVTGTFVGFAGLQYAEEQHILLLLFYCVSHWKYYTFNLVQGDSVKSWGCYETVVTGTDVKEIMCQIWAKLIKQNKNVF